MVEGRLAYRDFWWRSALPCVAALAATVLMTGLVWAQAAPTLPASALPGASPGAASAPPGPRWIAASRVNGRLQAADIGLVINTADPYSVQVGEYYIQKRKLAPEQVLRLQLPLKPALDAAEFEVLRTAIGRHFGSATQALALAWTAPYAVDCSSITGALAMGLDTEFCKQTCGPSRPSPYFNSATVRPYDEFGWRPSMLLAARTVGQAQALIDRGVAADSSLARGSRPAVSVMLLSTDDAPRRVRMALYPPAGPMRGAGVDVRVQPAADLAQARRVLMVITGSVQAPTEAPIDWVPGGLGDHLTSFGGALSPWHGQGTALDWIASGATASHGTVTEPCNHLQKFPHPQVLLLHYLQGSTALEAYWKSVAWPQQAVFVGEPLAAPFAPAAPILPW
jgi:uncharacterized protein (TIGR03790 family)